MGFGEDTGHPRDSCSNLDIRWCTFQYAVGVTGNGHGVLLGRGTKKVYFVNNKIIQPSSINALLIGLVIKCTPSTLGDAIHDSNYVEAPRTIYLKGAQNCYIRFNTTRGIN